MSTTVTVGCTAYSVQSAKSSTAFGQLAKVPFHSGTAGALFRASLAKIPATATIVSAVVQWTVAAAVTGTVTVTVQPRTGAWPSVISWANKGALGTTYSSAGIVDPANGKMIPVVVTAAVQAIVSGTVDNLGWFASVSGATTPLMRGTSAASGHPVLVVTYTVPPPVPSNLQPSSADVTLAKPVLLFDADPNITGLQVQVDPAANGTSPAFDSGEVAATGGLFDLSASSYAGLAVGATTFWRVQQWTDGGPSGWSPWVAFNRVAATTLTITSPSGSAPVPVADGTPAVTWTYSGTQVAYRVRLLDISGDVIADSLKVAGTATAWTPPKGLVTAGQHGVVEVTVWPNSNRAATPGDPVESISTIEIVLTPSGAVGVFAAVTATSPGIAPTVTITGTRSAIPDYVALNRDGAEVGRWVGTDVCVPSGGGYLATVTDGTAVMGRSTVYSLAAVTTGTGKGAAVAAAAMVPTARGIWITDSAGNRVALWDTQDAAQQQPETSIVHQPMVDGAPVVRRRLIRALPSGTVTGIVFDVGTYLAADAEALLNTWAEADAGDTYFLTFAGYTGTVILGDIAFAEVNSNPADGRMFRVSVNYWAMA